uniref:Small nuclear ribonucleoprotein Sm D3 n=1 Tax=Ganoderma boninense TaxID=34458 RepID=A0A5K1JXU0_9APHY|nr:Ctr copper transporter family protein [Ganoderma boninense]
MTTAGLGVPVKLLHESLGHVITVELKTGQLYRGKLAEAEDNLNISLKDITVTQRDGQRAHVQACGTQCNEGKGYWYGPWKGYDHARVVIISKRSSWPRRPLRKRYPSMNVYLIQM